MTNNKFQINNKSQNVKFRTILNLNIDVWNLFVI